jgi:hypothetical protein
MRIWCFTVLLLAACQKQQADKAKFQASCKPDDNRDHMVCVVENIGKVRGRACVTSREQVPKARPLIAQRVCTKPLEPGEKLTFKPKFDRVETLQPVCAPEGTWICRDEIVETPQMLGENIPSEKK